MKVLDIRFVRGVRNPDKEIGYNGVDSSLERMTATAGAPMVVDDDGPWLVIRGKRRTVRTPRSNVVDLILVEEPAQQQPPGAPKDRSK